MSRLPLRLVVTVAVLEVVSGTPYGLVNDFVPVWMREQGASLEAVGALSALALPWNVKAFWGPLVDRYLGFRTWIVGATLGIASVCLAGPALGDALVPALLGVAVLGGLQDVALDGWIVGVVPVGQEGRATGVRVAAYRGAMALGGGGAVFAGGRWGWELGWYVVAALVAVGLVATLLLDRPPRAQASSVGDWFRDFGGWLSRPGNMMVVVLALVFKLGDAAMAPMTKTFWLDSGLSAEQVGLLNTVAGSVATALGALVGGEVTSRIGLGRAALWLGGLALLSNLVYAGVALSPSTAAVVTAGVVESFTSGLGTAPLVAILMRACGRQQTATRFALLTSVAGLTRTLAGTVSGVGAAALGYPSYFALTAVLAIPGLLMVSTVTRRLRADET